MKEPRPLPPNKGNQQLNGLYFRQPATANSQQFSIIRGYLNQQLRRLKIGTPVPFETNSKPKNLNRAIFHGKIYNFRLFYYSTKKSNGSIAGNHLRNIRFLQSLTWVLRPTTLHAPSSPWEKNKKTSSAPRLPAKRSRPSGRARRHGLGPPRPRAAPGAP